MCIIIFGSHVYREAKIYCMNLIDGQNISQGDKIIRGYNYFDQHGQIL